MTADFGSWLGALLFLWIGLGLSATAQKPLQPAEVSGPYDCLRLALTDRNFKGALFDPAAFQVRWVSVKTRSHRGRVLVRERDPGLHGEYRVDNGRGSYIHLVPEMVYF